MELIWTLLKVVNVYCLPLEPVRCLHVQRRYLLPRLRFLPRYLLLLRRVMSTHMASMVHPNNLHLSLSLPRPLHLCTIRMLPQLIRSPLNMQTRMLLPLPQRIVPLSRINPSLIRQALTLTHTRKHRNSNNSTSHSTSNL